MQRRLCSLYVKQYAKLSHERHTISIIKPRIDEFRILNNSEVTEIEQLLELSRNCVILSNMKFFARIPTFLLILMLCSLLNYQSNVVKAGIIESNESELVANSSAHASSDDEDDSVTYIHKRVRGNTGRTIIVPIPKGEKLLVHTGQKKQPKMYNSFEQIIGRGARVMMQDDANLKEKDAIRFMQEKLERKSIENSKRKKERERLKRKLNPRKDLRKTDGPRSYAHEKGRSIAFMLKTKNNGILNRDEAEKQFEIKRELKRKKDREAKQIQRKAQREANLNKST